MSSGNVTSRGPIINNLETLKITDYMKNCIYFNSDSERFLIKENPTIMLGQSILECYRFNRNLYKLL